MIIEVGGIKVEGRVGGLDALLVTLRRREEDKRPSRSFTSALDFYDAAYELIRTELIDAEDGLVKDVPVKIYDDCCGFDVIFEGAIKGSAIDWCEDECKVTAEIIEKTAFTEAYDCLRSTYVYDNQLGFQNREHPKMQYCIEVRPNILQDLQIVYMLMHNITINSFIPIIAIISYFVSVIAQICVIINDIIDAINTIPAINVNNLNCEPLLATDILGDFLEFKENMNERIVGCNLYHVSPLVRDYITNVCEICGISGFSSSILNTPSSDYYNTVYFNAPVRQQDRLQLRPDLLLYNDNKPLLTGERFLNQMSEVFNGDYWLKDNVIQFERKDFFISNEEWISVESLGDRLVSSVCFEWTSDELPAVLDIKYLEDFLDECGQEAIERYRTTLNINDPFNPNQKGVKELLLPIAPSRNRDDGIERDVLSYWGSFGLVNSILSGALNAHKRSLILSKGIAFAPKLLIWDGVSLEDGKVKSFLTPNGTDPADGDINFNYPFWIDPTQSGNLYDRFFEIEDPRLVKERKFNFSFSFRFTCEELRSFDFNKHITLKKGGQSVQALPSEIQINYKTRTIEVRGIV